MNKSFYWILLTWKWIGHQNAAFHENQDIYTSSIIYIYTNYNHMIHNTISNKIQVDIDITSPIPSNGWVPDNICG